MGFRRSLVRIQSPRHARAADSNCQRLFSFGVASRHVDSFALADARPFSGRFVHVWPDLYPFVVSWCNNALDISNVLRSGNQIHRNINPTQSAFLVPRGTSSEPERLADVVRL